MKINPAEKTEKNLIPKDFSIFFLFVFFTNRNIKTIQVTTVRSVASS